MEPLDDRCVFVFGAGATRAFAPKAPLVEDDYDLPHLLDQFRGFPHAYQILENERHRREGRINVEQLMTRLHGRMPYDTDDARAQQAHLLSAIMQQFVRKIRLARLGSIHKEELSAFARLIIKHQINCISFNYDDILDEALWKQSEAILAAGVIQGPFSKLGKSYWHPDGGYGFFVRPSAVTINAGSYFMDKTSMALLKLHGSINWFPKSGEKQPYSIDAILHDEDWCSDQRLDPRTDKELIGRHLENDPFLVPPVLDKTALGNEPVIRTTWALAKERLALASRVYFVGYSMPMTDLAGTFLFSETLGSKVHLIRVINLAQPEKEREQIRMAYRKVFPNLQDEQFDFDGALAWANRASATQ